MRAALISVFGFLLLGAICFSALMFQAEGIQASVEKRAAKAMRDAGAVAWAKVVVDGRDIRLRGTAPSEAAKTEAIAALQGVSGVRSVGGYVRVDAPVSPYVWRLDRSSERIVLSGVVPDAQSKRSLHDLAQRTFGRPVDDRTRVARGVPEGDWLGAAGFAVKQLAQMNHGEAVLHDTALTLSGQQRTPDQDLTEVFAEAAEAALISPFEAKLEIFTGEPDSDPDEVAAEAEAAAESDDSPDETGSQLAVLPEAQESLADAAGSVQQAAVAPLDDSDGPKVEAVAAVASGTEAGSGTSFELLAQTACQQRIDALTAERSIVFPSGRRSPTGESKALIADIATALETCRHLSLEVAGHTDSTGKESANKRLSGIRARAVAKALAEAGFPTDHITAVGHGSSKPIADNGTEAGRSKNRRIELTIKAQQLAEN